MTATLAAMPAWYFEERPNLHFVPTGLVGGGWNPSEQHIAPALGLLTHLVEQHHEQRRGKELAIGRLCFDIHGVLPMEPFRVEIEVVRPGRTIELVEARIFHGGRTTVVLRAWLLAEHDSSGISGSPQQPIPSPEQLSPWEFSNIWPGGFVRSIQTRRYKQADGKGIFWVDTDVTLLKGHTVSSLARLMGLVDVANGAMPRVSPIETVFPNVDLTAHLVRSPCGSWVGFDTSVSFGPTGIGVTHSLIHDSEGFLGVVSQCLTVRPMASDTGNAV